MRGPSGCEGLRIPSEPGAPGEGANLNAEDFASAGNAATLPRIPSALSFALPL